MLYALQTLGESVVPVPSEIALPDPDDRAFLEVALSGDADALVAGNHRHFPAAAVAVLSPAQLLAMLGGR
jgi:predicted nucleic acid-binding protein